MSFKVKALILGLVFLSLSRCASPGKTETKAVTSKPLTQDEQYVKTYNEALVTQDEKNKPVIAALKDKIAETESLKAQYLQSAEKDDLNVSRLFVSCHDLEDRAACGHAVEDSEQYLQLRASIKESIGNYEALDTEIEGYKKLLNTLPDPSYGGHD